VEVLRETNLVAKTKLSLKQ